MVPLASEACCGTTETRRRRSERSQSRTSRPRTDTVPAGRERERDVRERRRLAAEAEGDVVEGERAGRGGRVRGGVGCGRGLLGRGGGGAGEAQALLGGVGGVSGVEDLADALGARGATGEDDHEVREVDDGEQRLGHVADEGDDLALREAAGVDRAGAGPEDRDDAEVHDEDRGGVEQGREAADADGRGGLPPGGGAEALGLVALAAEGADGAGALEGLAADAGDVVEARLGDAVERHGARHHEPEDEGDHGRADEEDAAEPEVDEAGGRHRAHGQERPAQELADREGDGDLHLVDVAREARDEGRGAEAVGLAGRQRERRAEEGAAGVGAHALGDDGGHLLAHEGRRVSDEGEADEQGAAREHGRDVARGDAEVDHLRDDDGRHQVEHDLDALGEYADGDARAVRRHEPLDKPSHQITSCARLPQALAQLEPLGLERVDLLLQSDASI